MTRSREAFGDLRGLLHQSPSTQLWRTLTRFVETFDPEVFAGELLEYLRAHLSVWPDELRVAPRRWLDAVLQGEPAPWLGIARVIRYSGVANLPQGQEDYGEFPAFVEPGKTHGFILVQQLEGREAAPLIQHPYLDEVGTLELASHHLRDPGAGLFVKATHLVNLRDLVLSSNGLTARGATSLAKARSCARLERLILTRNRIDDAGFSAIVTQLRHLRELSVLQNHVTTQGAVTLARDGASRDLELLDLRRNPVGHEGVAVLCDSDRFPQLHTLDLRGCELSPASARVLARSTAFPKLKRLHVSVSEVGAGGLEALLRSRTLSEELKASLID